MLDENTKIKLPHVFAAIMFLGSLALGWSYTMGKINDRLLALEKDQAYSVDYRRESAENLKDVKAEVKETNRKVDRLLMANGIKPEQ